jgi:segregation and condensation protein B
MALKQQIEVILFWKSKTVTINSLVETLDCSPDEAKRAIMDLIREYELRDSGLQIVNRGNGFLMEPREEYANVADKLAPVPFKQSTLRTLALIALREPIKQSEIVDTRGSGAYDHVRELAEANWVEKEQVGSTFILKTTAAFKKNFKISDSGGDLKQQLKKIFQEQADKNILAEDEMLMNETIL